MSAIPSKIIMLRTLANVPVSEYADIRPPENCTDTQTRLSFIKRLRQKPKAASKAKDNRHRTLSFNAAVWMRFSKAMQKPVSLWLSYQDASGENTILVDEQYLNESSSAMLSGTVTFTVKGQIDYLRACCGGVAQNEGYSVDEIHVRRQEVDHSISRNVSFSGMVAP